MARSIVVGYFLEDIAHERFMTTLVHRIALEQGVLESDLRHDVRNATGGTGAVLREFRLFLRDYTRGDAAAFDITVAAIDGNCMGYVTKRNQLLDIVQKVGYGGTVVCAIPDPHIERWYMADPLACQQVMQCPSPPTCPTYKCEKDRYKKALSTALKSAGVITLLGGAEFGPQIAELMDLYKAEQADNSFHLFVQELRIAFAALTI